MMKETFSVIFKSDVARINDIVNNAMRFVTNVYSGISEDTKCDIRLILSESLFNAVMHGNDGNEDKKVSLKINAYYDGSVTITISDEGDGFDYKEALSCSCCEESLFLESGRGLKLVNALSDEVYYNKKGSEIIIYKKVVSNG